LSKLRTNTYSGIVGSQRHYTASQQQLQGLRVCAIEIQDTSSVFRRSTTNKSRRWTVSA